MNDYIAGDMAQMRTAASAYLGVAAYVDGFVQDLRHRIEAEGECWGADDPGADFAQGYADAARSTLHALLPLYDMIGGIVDKVRATATDIERTEDEHSRRLDGPN